MKLLLIDPNERSLRVYQDVFESWGFTVISASHKDELYEIMDISNSFDIIITEIDLPEIKQGMLIQTLRQKLPDSPIIVLTDHHSVSSAVSALKNGVNDFLLKPFVVEKLKDIVFNVLSQKQHNLMECILPTFENSFSSMRKSLNQTIDQFLLFNQNLRFCDSLHRESCEHISEALLMLDRNERVILINKKMRSLLGMNDDKIIGSSLFQKMPALKNSFFYTFFHDNSDHEMSSEYKSVKFFRPVDNCFYELDLKVISMKSIINGKSLLGMIFIGKQIKEKEEVKQLQ